MKNVNVLGSQSYSSGNNGSILIKLDMEVGRLCWENIQFSKKIMYTADGSGVGDIVVKYNIPSCIGGGRRGQ